MCNTHLRTGPDWTSKLRRIPAPSDQKETIFCPPLSSLRRFNLRDFDRAKEYEIYPPQNSASVSGRRSHFSGGHGNSRETNEETLLEDVIGRRTLTLPHRNGLKTASLGDKPYQAVEYSKDYYKIKSMEIKLG